MNRVFAETFGLVLAESNAVGTPVLTHPLGAAPEVLGTAEQLIDTTDVEAVIQRIMAWRDGQRPVVKANPAFYLSNVANEWLKLYS